MASCEIFVWSYNNATLAIQGLPVNHGASSTGERVTKDLVTYSTVR